jgi:hypothetical protein
MMAPCVHLALGEGRQDRFCGAQPRRISLEQSPSMRQSFVPTPSMKKLPDQLRELEQVAERLGIKVSYEPMNGVVAGRGGLCRLRGQYRVIIDRRHKLPERVSILADALARFDLSAIGLSDEVAGLVGAPPSKAAAG